MPKTYYTPRKLPPEQPDRCELCPLVGIIPDDERRKGVRERYYCLGIFDALTDDNGHPLNRDSSGYRSHGSSRRASPCRPRR